MYIYIVYRGQPAPAQGSGGAGPVDQRGTVYVWGLYVYTSMQSHICMLLITCTYTYTPSSQIRNRIIADGGSIQKIPEISPDLKEIYRTVWEIRQRSLIDMAADR